MLFDACSGVRFLCHEPASLRVLCSATVQVENTEKQVKSARDLNTTDALRVLRPQVCARTCVSRCVAADAAHRTARPCVLWRLDGDQVANIVDNAARKSSIALHQALLSEALKASAADRLLADLREVLSRSSGVDAAGPPEPLSNVVELEQAIVTGVNSVGDVVKLPQARRRLLLFVMFSCSMSAASSCAVGVAVWRHSFCVSQAAGVLTLCVCVFVVAVLRRSWCCCRSTCRQCGHTCACA